MKQGMRLAACICFILTFANAASAQAPANAIPPAAAANQNGKCEPETVSDRTLKGHTFLFPTFVESPFIATYAGLSTRVSSLTARSLPTPFGTVDVKSTSLRESLDLSLKVAESVSIQASAAGRLLVGTGRQAIVYIGANYGYGFGLGATFRLARLEDSGTEISIRALGTYINGQAMSLQPLFASANAVVALQGLVQASLGELMVVPLHGFTYGGTFVVAQTISPVVGVQLAGGLGGSSLTLEPFDPNILSRRTVTTNGFNFQAGVAFDVDFEPMHAPVALLAEYQAARAATVTDIVSATELSVLHSIALGVFYSGRRDLQAGVVGGWQFNNQAVTSVSGASDRPDVKLVQLMLRYVW